MQDKTAGGVHWSFWLIGAAALIWNAGGVMNYLMQMNPDAVSEYPASHRAIIEGRPAWATGAFAIAVFGGALGGLALLVRRRAAHYLFIVSLLGTIVTMIHTLDVAVSKFEFGPVEILIMILLPLVAAAFLIWYSKLAERKRWLR